VNTTQVSCKFGNNIDHSSATFVSSTEITCPAPKCSKDCLSPNVNVHVEMTINGQDWTHDLMTFTYTHIPTVSYINPTRATTSGKPIVGVHGYNFVDSSNLKCRFSNETETLYVFARWRTTEWIDCASPVVLVTGSMNVAVTNNGEEYSSENMMLEYVEGATVTSLVPSTGPITGGTNIIVSGTNFEFSSLLSCRFGTDSTVPASYVSNNMVMCRSPKSNAAHVVPVVLVNGGAVVSSHLDAQYTYTEASRVLSITPDSVPTTGNATIQIQGLHFSNVSTLQCVFGEEKILAPAVYVSDTILECNTPVMSRPTKSIVVEVYIHSEYTTSDNIDMSFHSPPRTMSTSPREGSIQGGETISVYGHNFQDNQHLSCWFGTLQSPSVKFVSSKQIQCVSPLLESAADMLVSVSNNNVRLETVLSETAPVFSFKATIRVVSIAPLFGPSSGGTEIILTGEHFFGHAQAYCLFDMKKVKASFSDANKMSCIAPSAGIGQSTVRFSVNGVVLSDDTHMYNYITVPTITTISPSWSFVTGNVTVHITGTSFINSSTLACVVGDITVPATFRNTTNVECIIPSVSEPTNAIVQIDINGQDRTSDGTLFQYRKTPQVLMVSPRAGPNTGGTTIDVIGNNFVMWNNDVYCVFDNTQETQAVWISVTRCTCVSPPSLDGLKKDSDLAYEVSFRLKSAHVDFPAAEDAMAFKYLPPMSVNSFTVALSTSFLACNIMAAVFTHLENVPNCSYAMYAYLIPMSWFIGEYMWFENVHVYTYDIFRERTGFKMCWGCWCFYPFFYCIGIWPIVNHFQQPTAQDISQQTASMCIALFYLGWVLTRGANLQKFSLRHQKQTTFLFVNNDTIPGSNNKLLCSGWWGLARHINYLGEILQGLALALPGYFVSGSLLPFLYPFYYVLLFVGRDIDDDKACLEKYGKAWEDYLKRVPYRIVPGIY